MKSPRSWPCFIAATLLFCGDLPAQTTWDGGAGTSNWGTALNWNTNVVPSSGDTVLFTGATPTTIDLNADRTLGFLYFSGNSGYTLQNYTLTLTGLNAIQTVSPTSGTVTHTIASNIVMPNLSSFSTGSNSTLLVSGAISGAGSLTKNGSGTLTLSGISSYTGSTAVNTGTLKLTTDYALPTGTALTLSSGTTLDLSTSQLITRVGSLSGAGTVSGGNLSILITGDSSSTTFSGSITGTSQRVYKKGSGTWTLTGTNTFGGSLYVDDGLVEFSSLSNLGNSLIILSGGGLRWASGSTADISTRSIAFTSGSNTFDTNGNNVTLANAIGTSLMGFTKAGAGTLILSADPTYTETTTISGGKLQFGTGGTAGTIPGNVVNNGTLALNRSDTVTYSGVISGTGAFEKSGSGTTILTGANTYTGGTTINAGTLQIGDGTTGSIVGNVVNNGTLGFKVPDGTIFSGNISGTGGVTVSGITTYPLYLTGTNTYSGGTTLSAGAGLTVGNGGTTGSITGNVSIGSGAQFGFYRSDNQTFAGTISGTGDFFTMGGGTLTLTGGMTAGTLYPVNGTTVLSSGAYTVSYINMGSGSLTIDGATANVTGSGIRYISVGSQYVTVQNGGTLNLSQNNIEIFGTVTLNNGTLALGGSDVSSPPVSIGSGGGTIQVASGITHVLDGAISGSGTLQKTGAGTLAISNSASAPITVSAGTLQIGDETYGAAVLSGNIGNNSSVTANATPQTYSTCSGVISGTGSLSVTRGDLYLTGNNTYTGGTSVSNGGTLFIGNGGTSGWITGSVNLNNGALEFYRSDNVTFADTISGSNSGSLYKGGSGNLTLTKSVTAEYGYFFGGTTTFSGNVSTINELVPTGGDLVIDGASTQLNAKLLYASYVGGPETITVQNGGTFVLTQYLNLCATTAGTQQGADLVITGSGSTLTAPLIQKSKFSNGVGNITVSNGGRLNTGYLTDPYDGTSATLNNATIALTASSTTDIPFAISSGGGTLEVGSGITHTLSDSITGSGSLTKTGAGTLKLTGSSTLAGTTTISAGTLQIGDGGSTGSFSGAIQVNSGTSLIFKKNTLLDHSSVISGAGSVIQNGTAGLQLSGANTFTGNLVINTAHVQIGDGGSTGSITSDVTNNAILIFNRSTDYTYGGVISGGGDVYKVNSNQLTFSGNNTYTGTTYLQGGTLTFSASSNLGSGKIDAGNGTLQWASGNATDISSRIIDVTGAATFDTNGNNVTFANAIGNNGSGSLTKTGLGTLTFSGANTWSGTTTVNQGKLLVNGSLPGGASIGSAGALGGSGTIAGSTTVQGTLFPGSSPGVITFGSNLTLSDAITVLEIQGTTRGATYDGINVGSVLTYDGTLQFSITSGLANNTTYDLFSFGSKIGEFDTLIFSGGVYTSTWAEQTPGIWTSSTGTQLLTFTTASGDLTVIPEPRITLLFVSAVAAISWRRRRVPHFPARRIALGARPRI